MKWGDVLCGEIVTPESWLGGIVESKKRGEWGGIRAATLGTPFKLDWGGGWWEPHVMAPLCKPIFPPRGWAGKTDAQLLRELGESRSITPYMKTGDDVWIEANGVICACGSANGWYRVADPAALILALQNAQVLAARLQEPA